MCCLLQCTTWDQTDALNIRTLLEDSDISWASWTWGSDGRHYELANDGLETYFDKKMTDWIHTKRETNLCHTQWQTMINAFNLWDILMVVMYWGQDLFTLICLLMDVGSIWFIVWILLFNIWGGLEVFGIFWFTRWSHPHKSRPWSRLMPLLLSVMLCMLGV